MCWSVNLIEIFKIPHRRPEWHLQKETFRWLHKQGNHHQSEMSQSLLLQIQRRKVTQFSGQAAKLKKKKKVKVKNQKKVKIRKGTKPYIRRKWFFLHFFFFIWREKVKVMKGTDPFVKRNRFFLPFVFFLKWRWRRRQTSHIKRKWTLSFLIFSPKKSEN